MRNVWMVSMVLVAAGCGAGSGSQPWDKNHDGLVAQCEGLDRFFCGLYPGCEGQELACLAICRDDGKGGCLPCPSDFQCVPKQQLPPSCALVSINSCASIPQCEVRTETICAATHGGSPNDLPLHDGPPEVGCGGGGCVTSQVCVNKPAPTCESTPVASCTLNPACQLQSGPVCEVACTQGSPCPPCATPHLECVTRPPTTCQNLPITQCTSEAGCMVEQWACPAVCEDDGKGGCKPCPQPPPRCVPLPGQPEPTPAPPPTK